MLCTDSLRVMKVRNMRRKVSKRILRREMIPVFVFDFVLLQEGEISLKGRERDRDAYRCIGTRCFKLKHIIQHIIPYNFLHFTVYGNIYVYSKLSYSLIKQYNSIIIIHHLIYCYDCCSPRIGKDIDPPLRAKSRDKVGLSPGVYSQYPPPDCTTELVSDD